MIDQRANHVRAGRGNGVVRGRIELRLRDEQLVAVVERKAQAEPQARLIVLIDDAQRPCLQARSTGQDGTINFRSIDDFSVPRPQVQEFAKDIQPLGPTVAASAAIIAAATWAASGIAAADSIA